MTTRTRRQQRVALAESFAGRPETAAEVAMVTGTDPVVNEQVEHLHVWLRDFFGAHETEHGYFTTIEEAASAASQILMGRVKMVAEVYGSTTVIRAQVPDTARIRPCTNPACRAMAVMTRLEDDL